MADDRHAELDWRRLIWAAAAVLAGCALLILLGAPARMPTMNGAAFLIGIAGLGVMLAARRLGAGAKLGDWCLLGAAMSLPIAAFAGPQMDGVGRWLVVAGITIQPALIIVPLLALAFAVRSSIVLLAAIAVAALGVALQPDPGAAAMLTLGLAGPLFLAGGRRPVTIAGAALAGTALAVAQARAVDLPPVPFVEQILAEALRAGPLAACLALAAAGLLLMPAAGNWRRPASPAFLAVWSTSLAMSLLGPYPTPVIGFGGSAILGYVMSVGLLAGLVDRAKAPRFISRRREEPQGDRDLHFA